ncbi:MAG TPA: Fe-S cluster assembly protein SufD [Thermoanaerobaculia bacterium]|nr:Fe-S cluster assembly protein SufD [Thermoanaerobaculia bacterium]
MATVTQRRAQEVTDRRADWVEGFAAFAASRPPAEPGALEDLRRRAIERFGATGFPTTRWEQWRKTDVRPISQQRFERVTAAGAAEAADLAPHAFAGAHQLVFVDGFFVPALSDADGLPEGVRAGSLAAALDAEPEAVEAHLGHHAVFEPGTGGGSREEQPFVALNTALFADGAWLRVPRGVVVEKPIHLLFLSSAGAAGGEPPAAFPRNLIVLDENAQATVVESYGSTREAAAGARYWTCPVTEVVLGPAAVLDHYKVQREGLGGLHVAALHLHQRRDSSFFSHSVSTGGALTRNDVGAVLAEPGIECTLNGLYVVTGEQLVDNHMRVDHVAPHCNSYELYKGILDGSARSVFNGLIHVHPGAQKTDAKQSNRNLLLSRGALASSNPQLEIFADDVRCTHGSTVGQLDEDAVFYLRSRGIGAEAAQSLLTYAFASDIISRIKVEPVRRDLEEFLFERLPRGEVVRQAV